MPSHFSRFSSFSSPSGNLEQSKGDFNSKIYERHYYLYHFNECVHFQTDLFDTNYQADLLASITIIFNKMSLVYDSRLLAEQNCIECLLCNDPKCLKILVSESLVSRNQCFLPDFFCFLSSFSFFFSRRAFSSLSSYFFIPYLTP